MDSVRLLRDLFNEAHQTLEGTMADVTPEQAHWTPPGRALPIAAQYAHVVVGEDVVLNSFVKKGAPLFATARMGKLGLSELPPDAEDWGEWARRVRIELPAFREYARAVYAATDAYLASLTPEDVAAEVDLFGSSQTLAYALGPMTAGHVFTHAGEISCLKGLQGAKGYPF